jgi:hypothetical protein
MEKLKNYVNNQKENLSKRLNEYKDTECLKYFLTCCAHEAYKISVLYDLFIDFEESVGEDLIDKKEAKDYIVHTITHYEKKLLSGKVFMDTTNPMRNLLNLWEFETYPELIDELRYMLKLIND